MSKIQHQDRSQLGVDEQEYSQKLDCKKALVGLCAAFLLGITPSPLQAGYLQVGKGTVSDTLKNSDVTVAPEPKIAPDFIGKTQTNNWDTSILKDSPTNHYSSQMFPHPLAAKATASGLQVGYPNQPVSNGKDYQYVGVNDFILGLAGCNAPEATMEKESDWLVTAQWLDPVSNCSYNITYGHGLPFVYMTTPTAPGSAVLTFAKASDQSIGTPLYADSYIAKGITGTYNGGALDFTLLVDAANTVGVSIQVRVTYDFNGTGTSDKIETHTFFAMDPIPGKFEKYLASNHPIDSANSSGQFQDFHNGQITVEVWRSFGKNVAYLNTVGSFITLPYDSGKSMYFAPGATTNNPSTMLTQPSATSGVDTVGLPVGNTDGSGIGRIWYQDATAIGVTINQHPYAIFAPQTSTLSTVGGLAGQSWVNGVSVSLIANAGYLSVAILPDESPQTLQAYKAVAYNFPTDSQVGYSYNTAQGRVYTNFTLSFEAMQASQSVGTVMALYPHQWNNIAPGTSFAPYSYVSARGQMKTIVGSSFDTVLPFTGVLPTLPDLGSYDRTDLMALVQAEYLKLKTSVDNGQNPLSAPDTYWNGKEMARTAELAQIASEVGMTVARDLFVSVIKSNLEDWFDATSGAKYFYYNPQWHVMVGYPASYGSNTSFNDLHFHYGYMIKAAATIAMFDPAWASPSQYGDMVELLIRDVASPFKDDSMFPFVRNFDPYEGHSWAGGTSDAARGANQESSSEAMNLATGIILWGEATGHTVYRDVGVWLHATESDAIERYWFDRTHQIFPKTFLQQQVSILWGDGGVYSTYWTGQPDEIHAINYFPITAGHLYLGQDPAYLLKNFANMNANDKVFKNSDCPGTTCYAWPDIQMEWLAMADPVQAMALYNSNPSFNSEPGETKAHTLHWLGNMSVLGSPDPSVIANTALYSVFNKQGLRTYVAYNPSGDQESVTFSNGYSLSVPAHSFGMGNDNGPLQANKDPTQITFGPDILALANQPDAAPTTDTTEVNVGRGITLFQAENFSDAGNSSGQFTLSSSVNLRATKDRSQGFAVTGVQQGEYLEYKIFSQRTDVFTLTLRLSSISNAGLVHATVAIDGQDEQKIAVKPTGNSESFIDVALQNPFLLTDGAHLIRITFLDSTQDLNYFVLRSQAYFGVSDQLKTIHTTGSTTIQAEDYNLAYDTSSTNVGGAYRNGSVDIQACTDVGGGYNVGWTAPSEWIEYPVEIFEEGNYAVIMRVASGRKSSTDASGAKSFNFASDDQVLGEVVFTEVPGNQNFLDKTVGTFHFAQGIHDLKVTFLSDAINFNYFRLVRIP